MESKHLQKPHEPNSKGATMIEYALMAALIVVVCVVAISLVGEQASISFSGVGSGFQDRN